jgi:hypothetical protein
MNNNQRNKISVILLFVALIPLFMGLFSFLMESSSDKSVVVTTLSKSTIGLLLLGAFSCFASYKKLKYHKYLLLTVSIVLLINISIDFYRSFGTSFIDKLTFNIKVLSLLLSNGNYLTTTFLFLRNFISPVALFFLIFIQFFWKENTGWD